jgi:hypothetical protein
VERHLGTVFHKEKWGKGRIWVGEKERIKINKKIMVGCGEVEKVVLRRCNGGWLGECVYRARMGVCVCVCR